MAAVRPEVLWSPTFDDTFLVWSSKLQLYQTVESDEQTVASKTETKIDYRYGETSKAKLIATNDNYQYIKCVSWYQGDKNDFNQHLIAVGLANGKIALNNFNKNSEVGKEFVGKNSRQVNSLAWNPVFHQFLAGGLDRAGRDNSLVVIDVRQRPQAPSSSSSFYDKTSLQSSDQLRPYLDLCPAEAVYSVEFSGNDPQIILAGVNNRLIKLYDMRSGKAVDSINTKATFNIVSDPLDSYRFASSYENIVHIWDVRNLERSVVNLTDSSNKTISKLSWCPTRYGFLASLPRDCSTFRLYDIQRNEIDQKEDYEPTLITRSVATEPSHSLISSFSWHPTHKNRVTIASYSGQLHDHTVMERAMMDFSNRNTVAWSSSKGILSLLEDHILQLLQKDISTVMRTRAIKRYGLQTKNLAENGLISQDSALNNLWTWLEEGRYLLEGGNYKFQGVWNILTSTTLKSEIQIKQWSGIEGTSKNVHAKVFKSDERSLALTLCSWGFDKDATALIRFMDKLEKHGHYTRAAAVAVFNLDIPKAIKILERGAERQNNAALNTTAMALAGFTNERKALWRETCSSLLKSISDPYIRATFAFLTGEAETFDSILNESLMTIQDRVAFACKYLSDVRLVDFVKELKSELIKNGDLAGILLTGLDEDGQDLLQRYIDVTGDVQTAAFVVIHALPFEPNSRPSHWVEQYRAFLNNLQLWKERALMDVLRSSLPHNKVQKKPSPQIYVSCNFCLKSVSAYVKAPGRARKSGTTSTQMTKMTACPNCQKPLPRCSLCLQHMGTPSKRGTYKALSVDDQALHLKVNGSGTSTKILSKFNYWFTWCQGCHHGGHAVHIMEWFKESSECPVGNCNCKCMEIDDVNRLGISISK